MSSSARKTTRRKILRWGAGIALGATTADVWAIEPRRLTFEALALPIRDLPVPFDGYRIAFVADMHYPLRIDRDFIRAAIVRANEFVPDLFVFGGDYTDRQFTSIPSLAGILEAANATDGVYGVLGNHDWAVDSHAMAREVERTSRTRVLRNEHVLLDRAGEKIALAGLEDLWRGYPDLEVALKGVPAAMPRIVISHNPDTAEMYIGSEGVAESRRVDLQLSGHTHGGEVDLPLLGPPHIPSKFGRKFAQGYVQGALHPVYVSRGIASPRGVRFRCPPEVTGITLVRAD